MASAQNSKDSAPAAFAEAGEDWNKATDSATKGVEHAKDRAHGVVENAKGSLKGGYDPAKNSGQGVVQSAKEKLGQAFSSTKGAAQTPVDSSKGKVQQASNAVENVAKSTADNVGQKVDQTTGLGKDKVQGATEKLNNLKISSDDGGAKEDRGANDQKGILQTIGETITQSAMSVKNAIVGKTEQTDANRKEEEDAIAEKLRKGGQQVGDKAGEAADDVQSKGLLKAAGEQLMQTSEVVGNQIIGSAQAAKESFMGTADRKQDHSVPVRQRAAEEVGAAKDTVVQTGDEKKEQAKGILQAVQETLMGKADQKQGHAVPDRQGAAEKGNAAKNTVMQTVEEKKEQGKGFMQSVADTLSPKQTETDRKIDRNAAADSGKHVGKGMV